MPGFHEKVVRPDVIRVKALSTPRASPSKWNAAAPLSVCLQHEMDHLNGVLFVDHISKLKRDRIRRKLEKTQRVASPRS